MKSAKIGSAALEPERPIGVPSSNPTHTPHRQFRRVAHEPGVTRAVCRSGLRRHGTAVSRLADTASGPALNHAAQRGRDKVRLRRADDRVAAARGRLPYGTVPAEHGDRRTRRRAPTLRRQHRVGRRQLEERDLGGAERQTRIRRERPLDPEAARGLDDSPGTDRQTQARKGYVARPFQRLAQFDGSKERAVGVRRLPHAGWCIERERLVLQHGSQGVGRIRSRCQGGQRHDRLEGASRLTPGVRGSIELRLAVGATADHRQDVAGPRVQGHERPLKRRGLFRQTGTEALHAADPV